jgi:hypothetical protein
MDGTRLCRKLMNKIHTDYSLSNIGMYKKLNSLKSGINSNFFETSGIDEIMNHNYNCITLHLIPGKWVI